MLNNIAFIGGIHGVGKSTISRQICVETKVEYLSASEVLKWEEINGDLKNKKVKNVIHTQDRLIAGLTNLTEAGKNYLLDGHYCLLNNNNEVINVPFKTFAEINPVSLNLITDDISEIKKKLEQRDNKLYDYNLLELMQERELHYANYLSKKMGVALHIGTKRDFSEILNALLKIYSAR